MKKHLLFGIAAFAALLTVSCQQEQTAGPVSGGTFTVNAKIFDEDGKTYLDGNDVKWGKGEYLMLYYNDGSDKFATSLSSSADSHNGSATASFDFSISPATAASYSFAGVYPASSVTLKESATKFAATLPAVQNGREGAFDPAAYLMVARKETTTSIPNPWTAWFRRATALNAVTIKGITGPISSVEFIAEGKNLSGSRMLNLNSGEFGNFSSPSNSVTVNYATSLTSEAAVVYFTSWGTSIASGESMTIRVSTSAGIYSKTITAGAKGINFYESKLNYLTVDFNGILPGAVTLKDFARSFATALDAWKANVATDMTVGNITFSGHYVPDNFTITVGANSYNKSKMYEIAVRGLQALNNGGTLNDALPAVHNYNWAGDAYNEASGNGGEFKNLTVTYNLLLNYASREIPYAETNSRWSNFCNYTWEDGSINDKGTPSVAGQYTGCLCLSRSLLIMARFYKYLLDNNITSGIPAACASMAIDSALYEDLTLSVSPATLNFDSSASSAKITVNANQEWSASASDSWINISTTGGASGKTEVTVSVGANTGSVRSGKITFSTVDTTIEVKVTQNEYGTATIKDFAKAFAGLITIWNNNTTSTVKVGTVTIDGHYVPASTTITVGGKSYDKSQMYDVCIQCMYKLLDGGSLDDAIPASRGYKWPADPYKEDCNFCYPTVSINFVQNFASRMVLYAQGTGAGTWPNFCSYGYGESTSKGTPSVSGYWGYCSAERGLLIMARWFKYIIDNNITSDFKNKMNSVRVGYELYGLPAAKYSSPFTQSGIKTDKGPGKLGQINGYNCGPHSLMQSIYKINKHSVAESTIATWAGTTSSGTGHDGLYTAINKYNSTYPDKKLTMRWYYYKAVTKQNIGDWMANPKTAVFFHLYYRNSAGHYELPYKIDLSSSSLTIANSLGDYYNGSNNKDGYYGYFETRTWTNQVSYINDISSPQVCVISAAE